MMVGVSSAPTGAPRRRAPDGTGPPAAEGLRHPSPGVLRAVTADAAVLLAPNPGPLTLDGTNTWLLRSPGAAGGTVVVDPGPDDPAHVDAVAVAAGRVELIVLTHRHDDHSGGVERLHHRTGAPVVAADPHFRRAHRLLRDGEVLSAAGLRLQIWAVPGHTADSIAVLVGDDAVLTGDTVLGRGSTVLTEPDGDLGYYLDSLRRLAGLSGRRMLPGHGPERPDTAVVAREYLTHRSARLAEVRAALVDLALAPRPASAQAVVERVYADVERELWPAAEQSVRVQLAYLAREDTRPGGRDGAGGPDGAG